jgi:cell division protein FtsN
MLFGLAIGLAVAFAVYVKDRAPAQPAAVPQPASLQDALDDNGEMAAKADEEAPRERRFTFYDVLPNFEIDVASEAPETAGDEPQAIVKPGLYVLQAGSFSTHADADRRRAELALHGIESSISRVSVNGRDYHRVYIGPTEDLDELNLLRSRLREARIDVWRIRLDD